MYTSAIPRESGKCNNKESPRQKQGGGNRQAQEGLLIAIKLSLGDRKAYCLELSNSLKEDREGETGSGWKKKGGL